MTMIRFVLAAIVVVVAAGCAIQRAQVAGEAQNKMVGLTKEQVLACMGPPGSKAAEGATEVWSYGSGDGRSTSITQGSSITTGAITREPGGADYRANTMGSSLAITRGRSCTINVVMTDGRVSRVNYAGATGGLLTSGEQCAFAVQNCAH
jgi:hypothetical protein